MNRGEFLAKLRLQLRDFSAEEREEALKFYEEYLDEAGPEQESAVLAELGSPEKVARIIRANCGFDAPGRTEAARRRRGAAPAAPAAPAEDAVPVPQLTLDGPDWRGGPDAPEQAAEQAQPDGQPGRAGSFDFDDSVPRAPQPPYSAAQEDSAGTAETQGPEYTYQYPAGGARGDGASNRTLWIILLVVTCPLWIGAVFGLIGAAFGIVGGLIGLVFGGIGTMIAGVAALGGAVGLLFRSLPSGVLMIGLSLLCIAAGAALSGATVWAVTKVTPVLTRAVRALWRAIFQKVR